jgi:hypothetical protein
VTAKQTIEFETLILQHGAHAQPSSGMCFMEAVAYFRGIPHTDRPPCVSPAIAAFGRSWNDALNDTDRQMLKPYVFNVVGTNTTPEDELRRAWLATDWLVRTFAPAWLVGAAVSIVWPDGRVSIPEERCCENPKPIFIRTCSDGCCDRYKCENCDKRWTYECPD